MLRASSLGLSFPPPTIFALQQCRRLCGVRSRDLARNGLNIASTSANAFQSTLPLHHPEQDTDGKQCDVSARTVYQTLRVDFVSNAGHTSTEMLETTRIATSPEPIAVDDPATKDENGTDEFFKLMEEELRLAGISPETLSFSHWNPPVTGQSALSRIPIKPVNVSVSRHAPLTLLISQLRTAHELKAFSERAQTLSGNTFSPDADPDAPKLFDETESGQAADEHSPDPLPPRDVVAQIWKNLQILGNSPSSDESWNAYVYLLDVISEYPLVQTHVPQIPFSHLHRFCRVLSRTRPKTHQQYLRLLSVMTYTKHCGGTLHQFEINALIDMAGKGLRKMHPATLETQLGVFTDVRAGQLPGASLYAPEDWQMPAGPAFHPDVVTLTSLITSAARAGATETLGELVALMNKSGILPNRVTHLAMIGYYVKKEDVHGLRDTLQRMRQLDLNLGIEGLNACIQAYSKLNKLAVVFMIYRLLRNNAHPEEYRGPNDINETSARLAEEFIFVEAEDLADKITYTLVIQVMAYHGQFRAAIEVFLDMLSKSQEEAAPLEPGSSVASPGKLQDTFHPTFAVYRGIFIGFCRHAVHPSEAARRQADDWTLANLSEIFDRFLTLPPDLYLSQAELWTIMFAFAKASDWDLPEMRRVWSAIDKRFGIRLLRPHGNSALANLKRRLFPADAE